MCTNTMFKLFDSVVCQGMLDLRDNQIILPGAKVVLISIAAA